ncbi:hypothetical protein B0T26DRAFT_749103 [Lasiosphaeria miniovina]|uniref:LYC1 C-terminal domain-containing protein n=1 Tax=Lasiosphaeria miniovina TaxID=1954250 RepID=A0AA40AT98_9PEZI|nr:uncharacterized protein B0T26DRAFT_749103 [Lasiosphaeria miniovina]KAK0721600.1 hypothetical protein B0T26DRAFT_749103 [Lasiosphaeria miniovina]
MGSSSETASNLALPDASSPELVLAHPTAAERRHNWTLSHAMWGGLLTREQYLEREAHLSSAPALSRDGGLTTWILTLAGAPPDARPILSSCETLRKRALVADGTASRGGGQVVVVEDGVAHGLGSVFTDSRFRGRGYAGRMMQEVGKALRSWQVDGKDDDDGKVAARDDGRHVLFSVLYSDIGKSFYARRGWAPFESSHATFPPSAAAAAETNSTVLRPITDADEIMELCIIDERLLRAKLARRAGAGGRKCVALAPDAETMMWHLAREKFIMGRVFSGQTLPTVRGAVYGSPGRRIWALWTRWYYKEGNLLNVLRLVVEDERDEADSSSSSSSSSSYLAEGVGAILRLAQAEAAAWRCEDVQLWNPDAKLRGLIERSGVEHKFIDRDSASIASLMWYGDGDTRDIDWVANEKFGWC